MVVLVDHNDTQSGDISDGIEIWTYIMIALSCFALVFNFWMFVHIGKYFPSTATYKIQRIDCLVTSLSQVGMIAQFLGSMDKHHNNHIGMHHCHIFLCSCSPAANCELPLFSNHTVSHNGQKSTKKSLLLFLLFLLADFLKNGPY